VSSAGPGREGPAYPVHPVGLVAVSRPAVRKRLAGVLAGARVLRQSDSAFSAWLEQFTERTDPILSWLGVVFALLVAAQLGLPARHATARILSDVITAIWAVFVADFALKLWLAPRKLRFLRSHWLQLLGLLAPTLRLLSFLRLARLGRVLSAARVLSASSAPSAPPGSWCVAGWPTSRG